jgi:redox-sensitive bicupin YhaK (pirin superfamily)
MSYHRTEEPVCTEMQDVRLLVRPREKDLGTFTVRRSLPNREQKMVGPFIFFDEMGPAVLEPGVGIDVRPHRHIGVATITYLFDGEIMHRDSLGFIQAIQPGAVNLMTAGSGIVHSERSREETLDSNRPLHGIQCWMALPENREEMEPDFRHFPSDQLPTLTLDGAEIRVILGSFAGTRSPVATQARILYLDVMLPKGKALTLPQQEQEQALYVVGGSVKVGRCTVPAHAMAVLPDHASEVTACEDTRFMVLGGDRLGDRHIWWNFVSSSPERIERAKEDWRAQRFGRVPGDDEFIPLP